MTPQVTEALVAAPGGQPQILSNQNTGAWSSIHTLANCKKIEHNEI